MVIAFYRHAKNKKHLKISFLKRYKKNCEFYLYKIAISTKKEIRNIDTTPVQKCIDYYKGHLHFRQASGDAFID